jgi:aminopeptidase N
MEFSEFKLNGKPDINTQKQLQIIFPFKRKKNLTFHYLAKPKQTMYFVGSESNDNVQIWTQGQGKYTSHWFRVLMM